MSWTREVLSKVETIHTIVALYEFGQIVRELVPMNYYYVSSPHHIEIEVRKKFELTSVFACSTISPSPPPSPL